MADENQTNEVNTNPTEAAAVAEAIAPASVFDPNFDIAIALMAFMGGLGTLAGPILGAVIVEPAQQYFALQFGASGWYLVLYGVLFLAVILLLPEGIVPTARRRWTSWMASRGGRASGLRSRETATRILAGSRRRRRTNAKFG